MAVDLTTTIWFWVGVVLIVSELFLPGLVLVFLGLACISVAGLRFFHLIESQLASFTSWFFLSIVYLLFLRQLMVRFFPAEAVRELTDEDAIELGKEVEVVTTTPEDSMTGRIKFAGSTWPARSLNGVITAGARARIVTRENIGYVIEKLESN